MNAASGRLRRLCLPLGLLLLVPCLAQAISGFQIDTFQTGTTESWTNGPSATNPGWSVDGGPDGVGDGFLVVGSNGVGGPGGVPATFNLNQWSGNYDSADITFIELDLTIIELAGATTSLEIRLVLLSSDTNTQWTSSEAFVLPEDRSWYHASFELSEQAMTRVSGTLSFDEVFSDVGRLMIRHDQGGPSPGGTQVASLIGIDNVRAIPEPSTALLLALGLAGLARRRS